MAQTQPPSGGLFGIDLLPNVDIQDFFPDVAKPVVEAIKTTVEDIITPGGVEVGDPQPPSRPIPVDAGSKELNGAVKAIDTVVGALNLALRFGGWLIPDDTEELLRKLIGALGTVRSWLD